MLDVMGRDEMRAGDADRQAVAEKLRVALDEGRLDLSEYDERLQRAYAAKTYGDLSGLLTDLPVTPPPATAPMLAPTNQEHATAEWLRHVWGSWVSTMLVLTAIWAIPILGDGHLGYYWPAWVAVPWGAVLVWTTINGLVGGEPRKMVAERAERERSKQLKRERKALEAEMIARGELPPRQKPDKVRPEEV
jgi:hypothetical protein